MTDTACSALCFAFLGAVILCFLVLLILLIPLTYTFTELSRLCI